MKSSLTNSLVSWNQEAISIIPITEYPFSNTNVNLDDHLEHGYSDISFFPSWQEFLNRTTGENPNYPDYMTFLLCKKRLIKNSEELSVYREQIIGILAVQLIDYDSLHIKNKAVIPAIKDYLYLSWIALDINFQSYNYFSLLFEFYYTLIRRIRIQRNMEIEGAAISIRRMRPILWSLFNDNEKCPIANDATIIKDSPRFKFHFIPIELVDKSIILKQDHVLILFKQRNVANI
jgi:hypothetical protein